MTITPTALLALARAATPGPWFAERPNNICVEIGQVGVDGISIWSESLGITLEDDPRNAAFIAAASPDVIAALCERVEALEAKLASVTAIDDIAVGALVAGSNAATARIERDAARIAALEALPDKE